MSLTTVAELRTALGVGTLYADATLQEVCDAADNVLLPFLWTNTTPIVGIATQHQQALHTLMSIFRNFLRRPDDQHHRMWIKT